jgi:hypothetical protein
MKKSIFILNLKIKKIKSLKKIVAGLIGEVCGLIRPFGMATLHFTPYGYRSYST